MFIGFSKNLGNGFRINVGHNFNTGISKRDNDRNNFVTKVLSELQELSILICKNLNISREYLNFAILQECQIELSELFTENNCYKIANIFKLFLEINEYIDKINFSEYVSSKTKEQITDKLFESRKIINTLEQENNLDQKIVSILANKLQTTEEQIKKQIKKQFRKKSRKKIWFLVAIIILALVLISNSGNNKKLENNNTHLIKQN